MYSVILTQYDGKILGPIAKVLGLLLNGIFIVLDKIGIPNVALSIILFFVLGIWEAWAVIIACYVLISIFMFLRKH